MKINKKVIVTTLALIGAVVLGIKGKGLLEKRKNEVANTPLPASMRMSVSVVEPSQGSLRDAKIFMAQLLATKSIKLSTKLAGFVEKVYVEESMHVKKGDLLVKIDATELRSAIKGLESALQAQRNDLSVARTIYDRNKKLYEIGGLPKEKLELSHVALRAKASTVENTTQKIAQLKHQLSYLKIVAPFDGVIDNIILHEGDLAATGKPIIVMSSNDRKLLFSFSPAMIGTIKKGDAVRYQNSTIGTIKSIYNTSRNGLAQAEVALQKPLELPVGATLTIEVQTVQMQGCVVPHDSLLHKKEGVYVMQYTQGHFTPLKVDVKLQEAHSALIVPCPQKPIARASEVKLAALPAYENVEITGAGNE